MKILVRSAAILLATSALVHSARAAEMQTYLGRDNGAVLSNRGMGWVFHFYDNVPSSYGSKLKFDDTLQDFAGADVVYLRLPWALLEPEEGRFNWSVVDSVAQRWIEKGKRVALRFTTSESWMRYATPQWVEKAGARGYFFAPNKGIVENGEGWEPDFDDPIYLQKLEAFLAAMAQRYDGNPNIEFIDVGSFGVWGEGHTWSSTRKIYPASTVKRHIDLYRKHFSRTLLVANDDFSSQDEEILAYALSQGLALRDDSIMVEGGDKGYKSVARAQPFWPRVPVILESEHYGVSRNAGHWEKGEKYLEATEKYHASYASIHWWPREFQKENTALIARMNQRLGYRLQLQSLSWSQQVKMNGEFVMESAWRNAGVAPLYQGAFPTLTLKTPEGALAATFTDENFDARRLAVGAIGEAPPSTQKVRFTLPFFLKAGRYTAFISMGDRDGTPRLALPLKDGDGARRYRVGEFLVTTEFGSYNAKEGITGDYDVNFIANSLATTPEGGALQVQWRLPKTLPADVLPFLHFEANNQIVFQGSTQGAPGATTLRQTFHFSIPAEARGKTYQAWIGLFRPQFMGLPNERLIPKKGEDNRVLLGLLTVNQNGTLLFSPVT